MRGDIPACHAVDHPRRRTCHAGRRGPHYLKKGGWKTPSPLNPSLRFLASLARGHFPEGREAASYRDGLLPDLMQSYDSRHVLVIKVAPNRISGHGLQVVPVFSLSEDAVAKGSGVVPTFNRFGYFEDDFGYTHLLLLRLSWLAPFYGDHLSGVRLWFFFIVYFAQRSFHFSL